MEGKKERRNPETLRISGEAERLTKRMLSLVVLRIARIVLLFTLFPTSCWLASFGPHAMITPVNGFVSPTPYSSHTKHDSIVARNEKDGFLQIRRKSGSTQLWYFPEDESNEETLQDSSSWKNQQPREPEPLYDHDDWVRHRSNRGEESENIATALFGSFVVFLWVVAAQL